MQFESDAEKNCANLIAQFLEAQCEEGSGFEVSEAVLFVVFSGWCKVEQKPLPPPAAAFRLFEQAGYARKDGKLSGIRIRGVDERGIQNLLGPALYEFVQSFDPEEAKPEPKGDDHAWNRGIVGDSVIAFERTCCNRHPEIATPVRELYGAYEAYCELNQRRPVRMSRFLQTLQGPTLGLRCEQDTVLGTAPRKDFVASLQPGEGDGGLGQESLGI